jgi:hypothetical protein
MTAHGDLLLPSIDADPGHLSRAMRHSGSFSPEPAAADP